MQIFLIVAVSADGLIAQSRDQVSTRWTSREDASWFARRTKKAGVCVMGRTTFQILGRSLPERSLIVQTSQPTLLAKSHVQTKQLEEAGDWHRQEGATEVITTSLSIPELADRLDKSGVKELAICGGASIYTAWLKSGLVERIYLTLEPRLFGQGMSLLTEKLNLKLKLVAVKNLNFNTLLLEYLIDL